jgi:hypothetical protein
MLLRPFSSAVWSQLPPFSSFWRAGPPGFQDGPLFPRIHTHPLPAVHYIYKHACILQCCDSKSSYNKIAYCLYTLYNKITEYYRIIYIGSSTHTHSPPLSHLPLAFARLPACPPEPPPDCPPSCLPVSQPTCPPCRPCTHSLTHSLIRSLTQSTRHSPTGTNQLALTHWHSSTGTHPLAFTPIHRTHSFLKVLSSEF